MSEIKAALLEEALNERNDEEMELSDSEAEAIMEKHNNLGRNPAKKPRVEIVNPLQVQKKHLKIYVKLCSNKHRKKMIL
jgi:hypothetical protein